MSSLFSEESFPITTFTSLISSCGDKKNFLGKNLTAVKFWSLLKEQLVLFSSPSTAILIVVVVVFCPCGIFTELSPEMDICSGWSNAPPEDDELEDKSPDDELEEDPPEDDELEEEPPEEEDELELEELPEDDDELEGELPEEEDELGLEEAPEDDELEELLDEASTQSANPRQLLGFDGQHPFIQQSGPHSVNIQSSEGSVQKRLWLSREAI